MSRTFTRRSLMPLMAFLLAFVSLASLGMVQPQSAGAVSIDCPAPASPTAAAAAASPAAAAAPEAPAQFPADGGNLTVFAAASLTDSFNQIKTDLEAAHPGLTITYNFAGSQALVTQLTEGSPADVFASASGAQMKAAQDGGVIDGSSKVFTQNRLAIVVPKDNPAGITGLADLAKDGVKLDLAQAEVPVGMYARQSICSAGKDATTYGDGFVGKVAANIVSEEDNVKAVLAKVQLGEADAGITYTTDVTADVAAAVTLIAIPKEVNVIAKYPIARVKGGNADLGQAFIDYILSDGGQATLQQFGFEPKP